MRDSCGETDQEMVREKIIQGQNITKEYKGVTEEQFQSACIDARL